MARISRIVRVTALLSRLVHVEGVNSSSLRTQRAAVRLRLLTLVLRRPALAVARRATSTARPRSSIRRASFISPSALAEGSTTAGRVALWVVCVFYINYFFI